MSRLLYNEKEAAHELGVSQKTLRGWRRQGLVRPVDLPGRRVWYSARSLELLALGQEPTS